MKRLISTTALSLVAGFALGATGAVADATKTDRDAMTGANVKAEAQSDPSGSGLTSAGDHGGSNPPGSGLTGAGGNDPVPQSEATAVPAAPTGGSADAAATNTGRDAQTGDRYTQEDPEGSGLTSAGSQAEADPDGSGLTGAGQAAATETDRDAQSGG